MDLSKQMSTLILTHKDCKKVKIKVVDAVYLCPVVKMVQFGLDAVDGFLHMWLSGIRRDNCSIQTGTTQKKHLNIFRLWLTCVIK